MVNCWQPLALASKDSCVVSEPKGWDGLGSSLGSMQVSKVQKSLMRSIRTRTFQRLPERRTVGSIELHDLEW